MVTGGYGGQTDRELAIGAANGDQRAFAALYDRYFESVYDFAVRTLRETDRAADVVQATFVGARESLGRGDVPPSVGAWLFTVARNAAIVEPAERPPLEGQRTDQARPMPSFVEVEAARTPNGQAIEPDREQRELVWESATELGPREYSVLDMNVRRGLSPAEIAAAMGMRADGAEQMLAGLRESLERTTASSWLIRKGGRRLPGPRAASRPFDRAGDDAGTATGSAEAPGSMRALPGECCGSAVSNRSAGSLHARGGDGRTPGGDLGQRRGG